ncbi:LysE family translocator [Caldimonas thermodepolymerans]|uniref:Lysine transporter LysE n=1 Tax=Caldimonas thermodepolymerans TaxID=215580 RepID=A0A2S5T7U4_9BURK|nr:LysE family translocator [Caldimonas thermodepolymerans]PPE70992.1 lysine transporter LysE [Caldimonas thermodepolymerans]QPC31291.1 LysE family translocator [Caldimonas thermodepolymerans]RDH99745.1 threonine/homoserine/homoserine lactone efflux protein [Caldimonas thermodepolymerans]TCP07529.1 threonine/homoserine/homoserine lactone efflux protein [Caldimonas thermodepolymerans]UZG44035.1 LysE family translocator [Caldimonas thermodepolymerans]
MTLQEFLALLVLATVMSFTPGPNTTLSTALAANGGLKSALRFCLAVPAGWTVLMLACGLGLGAVVTTAPLLRGAVKAVGIGYMLYLAWRLCQVRVLAQTDGARLNVGFLQGVALQFVNIKAWMLALALTGGWVVSQGGQPAANPGERLVIVLAVMAVYAFASNFTYALVGSLLRQWLAQGARLLVFNRVMAVVLAATALWMVKV